MKKTALLTTSLTSLALLPASAFAHTGHADSSGLMAGLMHPLTGSDHLLAMLAIGIWAATQKGRMQLAVPATFLLMLLTGFIVGLQGFALPLVETGIALSVLLLGLLLASAVKLPTGLTLTLTSLFALCHGQAHGAEVSGAALTFALGFLSTSLMLHLFGAAITKTAHKRLPLLARGAGALIAASGVYLLS